MAKQSEITRRAFLRSAAGALSGCASTSSARAQEVVDTHTHFYDPFRPLGVPWPTRDDKLLYRTVLPKDYKAIAPRRVFGTVVVEASPWVEDNQWILDLAAKDFFIVGFVGNLPIGSDQFAPTLKRFSSNRFFRGIRVGARKRDASVINDLKLLADRSLTLDLLGGIEIVPFARELSREIPTLKIVLDHVAGVRIDGKQPPENWVREMSQTASFKNVFCKVSGLVEGTNRTDGSAPRDAGFYAPVLDRLVEFFGPDRLIYASNWPVSARFAPLVTVQGIVEDYFAAQGADAVTAVMLNSGSRAYRWVNRIAPPPALSNAHPNI